MALPERLNEIHHRLLEGSRTASVDLFREAAGPLAVHVSRKAPGLSAEQASDVAVDAIVGYIQNPAAFDPGKSSLWTYLCTVAEYDARDLVRKRVGRQELMKKYGREIELWQVTTNNELGEVEWKTDGARIMRKYGEILARTEGERRVLNLMLDGDAVAAYAEALGLDPTGSVEVEVKRAKDRITLRMRKLRSELE
jgi:DNA-directed RNA polymerase specialized sigma24 family protein